jgi:hypothetical protein
VNLLRTLLSLPNINAVIGGVASVGLVIVVTVLFPALDAQVVAVVGAFALAALVAFIIL